MPHPPPDPGLGPRADLRGDPGGAHPAAEPLDAARATAHLRRVGVDWDLTCVATTGSTNADLVAALAEGRARPGSVLAAGEQTAGRGRMGRAWASPPGTTLSLSVALALPLARAGFVPALTGLAVAGAVRELGPGADAALKWPNDVMLAGRKAAGILAEAATDSVVVGCGVNVSLRAEDLPVPEATSLRLAGIAADRTDVLVAILVHLHRVYRRWQDAGFDAEAAGLLQRYRALCRTVGRDVAVLLPDGSRLRGRAEAVDAQGRLLLRRPAGLATLTAGDVRHLRE